ncbi:hypothetical protein DSM104299_01991 [Baekduia alba]|nr:hypothetical protein DSM104299_01991 [Baekduia alba]
MASAAYAVGVSTEKPVVNEVREPLVDVYGTPWGQALDAGNSDALMSSGRPTVEIPAGIPDVE